MEAGSWIAIVTVLVTQLVVFYGMRQSEARWRREETMRLLRWAAELAIDKSEASTESTNLAGLQILDALQRSPLLQEADQAFISAVLEAVVDQADVEDSAGETVMADPETYTGRLGGSRR